MTELANSTLLRAALSERPDDPFAGARERLRASLLSTKQHAALLAGEIARSFRHLTVHDSTHLDAVWEMADLAAGDGIELNALEAYVLGGAILLHDLGLSVAAYPDPAVLREEPRWHDTLTVVLEERLGRMPTKAEAAAADQDVVHAAEELLLRHLHASHAEQLALLSWTDDRGESRHLIEDVELRRATGAVIGLIAHSHWWETDELARQLAGRLGPPSWCPAEWTVDLLKLACLLRVADALHVDARRAPMFLRTLRQPSGHSADHWSFQERLNQPIVRGDRAEFTAGDQFRPADSRAWWLCYETLQDADRWLREVDALLSDLGRPRLQIRGVVGVDDPKRLSQLVRTAGWTPVDTHIKVSNLAGLIATLGGRELYGDAPPVALRELIQNGADAVRARRALQGRPADWGALTVRMGQDDDGHWLEVEDVGVGMSEHVLTRALLDFGTSYWASPDLPAEFPGLLAGGFQATGEFGIGFFSVFMLGSRVRVTTRPFRAGEDGTQVLTFDGLAERPLLQQATATERLMDGGTRVRVWLDAEPEHWSGLLGSRPGRPWTLSALCQWLCPGLDLTVRVEDPAGATATFEGDWRTMPANELVARLRVHHGDDPAVNATVDRFAANLRPLHDADGELVARLAIYPAVAFHLRVDHDHPGVVTIGGLHGSEMTGIMGLATGRPLTAARERAMPVVARDVLAAWATDQALLIGEMGLEPALLRTCATIVRSCGGDTGPLPIAESAAGLLDAEGVRAWAAERTQVIVMGGTELAIERARSGLCLAGSVIVADGDRPDLLTDQPSDMRDPDWPDHPAPLPGRFTPGTLEEQVADIVASAWGISSEQLWAAAQSRDEGSTAVVGTARGLPFTSSYVTIFDRSDDRARRSP